MHLFMKAIFNEINKKLDFKASSNEFQKDINYSFFINKEISSDKKKIF